MSLVTLRALGLTLGAPLFTGLDLAIQKGDRIGLVAANGRGKSTLLKVIAGLLPPSDGAITATRGTRIALMQQEPTPEQQALPLRAMLAGALPPETREWEDWRVDVALDALAVPADLRDRPLGALSGGWQRMAMLAAATLAEPDLLLLDEPTNHLDLARIGTLERFIVDLPRETAILVASHDRAFLDGVTNRTLFLRSTGSAVYAAPYGAARASLDTADEAAARRYETDLKQGAKLRRQAAKLHNLGVNSGSDLLTVKTKQLRERAERIESAAKPAHLEESAGRIRLDERGSEAKVLIAFDDLVVATPDGRLLFETGRRWIRPGERIVLLAPNGAGKSRFLDSVIRALRGEAVRGVRTNPSLVAGVVDQQLSHLGADETLQGAVVSRFPVGDQRARALLAGAGFPVERHGDRVSVLSGGQRARLAMLILRLEKPGFHVLDEPTNHLDIEVRRCSRPN
ncbi:ATPase subunit of ABC transporter with duplicated ATPase domains [Kaistia geumhonensis]|uniref:ATPase subunit of ABC transporter with duplicated ATPase domains n=1 Tax=Kaistia geumhonensis TaxID=410839 RepID=A0ABU0M7Y9_9HYPH|nr:ATPase subunit of ABC transporter with duplicated ATPase domains [Kaistia geumhonensis]